MSNIAIFNVEGDPHFGWGWWIWWLLLGTKLKWCWIPDLFHSFQMKNPIGTNLNKMTVLHRLFWLRRLNVTHFELYLFPIPYHLNPSGLVECETGLKTRRHFLFRRRENPGLHSLWKTLPPIGEVPPLRSLKAERKAEWTRARPRSQLWRCHSFPNGEKLITGED